MTPEQARTKPDLQFDWRVLQTTWGRRTQLAAQWLQRDRIVADIGCGLMALEPLLAPGSTYIPMDVVARDSRTIVIDFNGAPIPAVTCDVAVLLGVLEYSDSVRSTLQQLLQFKRVVFSYNHVSLNDLLWRWKLRRKTVNWRNRHTHQALRSLLLDCGYEIRRERRVRMGEKLYEVAPVHPPLSREFA